MVTVQDDFALQLVPLLLQVLVFHHDYHHVHRLQELLEIHHLAFHHLMVFQERVITFQWSREVSSLRFQQLQGWGVAIIVDVLLVGDTIQAFSLLVIWFSLMMS